MPEIWENDGDTSAFELPGDEERLAALGIESEEPEPPRDPDTGRFVAAQQEEAVEETPGEIQPPDAEQQEEHPQHLYANKYASVEELEKAYQHAQAKLSERDERAALAEQYEQALQGLMAQQQLASVDWETETEERPALAMEAAARAGDWYRYQQVAEAWNEVSPGAPELWAQQKAVEAQYAQLQQHVQGQVLGQRLAEIESRVGPLEPLAHDISEVSRQYPMLLEAFGSNDPQRQAQALEIAALVQRGLNPETLAQTVRENAQKLANDEQRARQDAALVTSDRTNRESQPSLAERIAAEWDDEDRRLASGWNI